MSIQNGIIFIWSGTHASIPSGWSRVTSMDDTYPKGTDSATNPNVAGGAATHTHTSPAHTHTAQSHTHLIYLNTGTGGSITGAGGSLAVVSAHGHSAATSGAVASFSCQSTTITYGAFSNDPPFYKVIYVTPTTEVTILPAGIITLADAVITGMNVCDGTLSTPNLVDKYLKGAAVGTDAGTTGGTLTDIHDITHTHTTSHNHAAGTTGSSGATLNATGSGTLVRAHTHSPTPNAATPTISYSGSLTTAESVEPAYTKLLAYQAATDIRPPTGVIAMWLGTLAAIPAGWSLVTTMQGRHLKITATVVSAGATGGANTHTHAAQSHTCAVIAHTHTVANQGHTSNSNQSGGGSAMADATTIHTAYTDSVNLVTDVATTTANSSNNEPSYRTVAFIKLSYQIEQASFIFNML